MFPLYTKTFGGKILKNLHSVSPGNFLDKNFKRVPFEFFPPKKLQYIPSCTHKLSENDFCQRSRELCVYDSTYSMMIFC